LHTHTLANFLQAGTAIGFNEGSSKAIITMLAVDAIAEIFELHHVYPKGHVAQVSQWVMSMYAVVFEAFLVPFRLQHAGFK
jgi:hypothetical protein